MIIQFNTDNNLTIHEAFGNKLKDTLNKELGRFDEHLTRIEVHLSDVNGQKNREDDKKCIIEARIKGMQPIVVTDLADTHENSVKGAALKLKSSLDTIIGKLKDK